MRIRTLHPLLAAKARDELNEEPRRIEESLRVLKEWIAVQPHLKVRTGKTFYLIAFIKVSLRYFVYSVVRPCFFYFIRFHNHYPIHVTSGCINL